jgi:hypothetical protein
MQVILSGDTDGSADASEYPREHLVLKEQGMLELEIIYLSLAMRQELVYLVDT